MEEFCADQDGFFVCVLGGGEEGSIMLISLKAGFARISKPGCTFNMLAGCVNYYKEQDLLVIYVFMMSS